MMTRSDFEAVAASIREARPLYRNPQQQQYVADKKCDASLDRIVRNMVVAFTEINPKFDADRFWAATYKEN